MSHLNLSPDEKNNVIIVVPYRDREEHLKVFLEEIPKHFAKYHPDIGFKIVVVEQADDQIMNRGKIKNIGFDLHRHEDAYFCFHDVDLIPESKECNYSYPTIPVHASRYCSQFEYTDNWTYFFGGVVLFSKFDFWNINGYSNEYWGWGGEDNDLYMRVAKAQELKHLIGYGRGHGRFKSLPHPISEGMNSDNSRRYNRFLSYDWKNEGLNSLKYDLIETIEHHNYTHHKVHTFPRTKPFDSDTEIKIKVYSHYNEHNSIDYFARMCKDSENLIWNNIRLVNSGEDVKLILNWFDDVDIGKHARLQSIVMQMEPSFSTQHFPSVYSNVQHHREHFLFVYDTLKYHNNIEWHISPTYTQLTHNEVDLTKTSTLSSVMSSDRSWSGPRGQEDTQHSQRLDFLYFLEGHVDIDIWGRGQESRKGPLPLREKDKGLFPYKYTYSSENTEQTNYFTEKIVDPILSECLCFYHGCPNLHDFIHPKSYIRIDINDFDGSLEIIKSAIANNEWEKRLPYIRESKDKILNELQMFPTLEKILS